MIRKTAVRKGSRFFVHRGDACLECPVGQSASTAHLKLFAVLPCHVACKSINTNEFVFTGVTYKEGEFYSALYVEVDVASAGLTSDEAAAYLFEAVALYMETAFEANLPYMRSVPAIDDPRMTCPKAIVKVFGFKVDFQIKTLCPSFRFLNRRRLSECWRKPVSTQFAR